MKTLLKNTLTAMGVELAFTKNLWYQDPYRLLPRMVTKTDPVIFDVGACDGVTSRKFKQLFPQATIHAFEPFPDSFSLLSKTAAELTNVHAHQLALSNFSGTQDFFVNQSKATNSLLPARETNSFIDTHVVFENKISVQTTTLDNFLNLQNINEVDILKMDVQGGELMVLEGARQTLENKKTKFIYTEIWFIEGYEGQPLYHDIAHFLHAYDYLPFGVYHIHYRHDGHQLWGDALFYLKENDSVSNHIPGADTRSNGKNSL